VGSGTIAGTIARLQAGGGAGLSSATVRNEMAELANEGLLEQPHTSAGRVPTARAFRMYVEQLSGGAGMARLGRESWEQRVRRWNRSG
jgi:transcriptional regulator of heat shock response